MTTIAYRNGVLAADSLARMGNQRAGSMRKIARKGDVFACASGAAANATAFLDWFVSGMKGDPPSMGDPNGSYAIGYIIPPDDRFIMWGPLGWEWARGDYLVCGSGEEYAAGAMEVGATAEQAVAAAIACDTGSGPPIVVMRR